MNRGNQRKNRLLASALAAVITPSLLAAPFNEATVTRTYNDVYLIDSRKEIKPAKPSDVMNAEMVLATGESSRAELQFPDQTLARIGSNSYFSFSEGTRDMELGKGTMLLKVPKNLGGAKITTQAVTAAITGTTVMLETNPGPSPVFLSGITVPPLPGFSAAAPTIPTSRLDGTYKDQGKTTAIAKEINGTCRILRPGTSQSIPLKPGDPVPIGSYVMTDNNSTALISPMPGIAVTIDNGTSTRLETLASSAESSSRKPEIHFDLKKGTIHTAIARGSGEPVDFRIRTPQGIAAARGTVTSTFTDGNTSNTFSIHGNVVWIYPDNQEQPIVPGSLIPFTGQGSQVTMGDPIPPTDPQFQRFLRRAVTLVNRAADAGLIRPDLPVAVLQTARQKNVPLTRDQESGLQKPRENTPPANTNPGPNGPRPPASGEGNGYSKLVVLEGDMRVYLNDKVGESRVLRPGQMIILDPNATRLPEPVNVRLDRLLKTSKLIGGFTETSDNDGRPTSGENRLQGSDGALNVFMEGMTDEQRENFNNLSPEEQKKLFERYLENQTSSDPVLGDSTIQRTTREQEKKLLDGKLNDTNLNLVGTTLTPGDNTDPISNRSDTIASVTPFRGRPTTYPGTFTVGTGSGVSTNPRLVDNLSTPINTINGNIYYPQLDGSFTDWATGSTNLLDVLTEVNTPFSPGELLAGFKADQFRITGNPDVVVGSIFDGIRNVPVDNLAFIGVSQINFQGSPVFTSLNGGFDRLSALLFMTEDGPINVSGSSFDLPNLETLAFYARESDVSTIGLGGSTPTSGSNLNLNNITFRGNELIGIAGRNLDLNGASIGSGIDPVELVELAAGHRVTIGAGTSVFANEFDAGSLLTTEMTGGTIDAFHVILESDDFVSATGGTIRAHELELYAGNNDGNFTVLPSGPGSLFLDPSIIDDTNLDWVNISAGSYMEFLGDFGFNTAPYTRVSVGDDGMLYASGYLKSIDELYGGLGSLIEVNGALQARMVDVDALIMNGTDPILPFLLDPNDPNRLHDWDIGSFAGNLNPFFFFGIDGYDSINGGTGGELDLSSSGDLIFGTTPTFDIGFGDGFFNGGNASSPTGNGGNGGLLFLTAGNDLLIYDTLIEASTGQNGTSILRGGQGGELDFSSERKTVIDNSILSVSSEVTGEKSNGGGKILIESNYSKPIPNDPAISIQNSSQILGLLDAGTTGRGSQIVIQSNANRGDIVVDNSWVEASGTSTERGSIDIQNNGQNSSIDIVNSTIKSNDIRIMSNFAGGTINITSGSNISATNLLKIAAGFDSTNMVRFSGGGPIMLQGSPIDISGYTVQIDNGTNVNNIGTTNVTAQNHNYNGGGFGSFDNPVNQLSPP